MKRLDRKHVGQRGNLRTKINFAIVERAGPNHFSKHMAQFLRGVGNLWTEEKHCMDLVGKLLSHPGGLKITSL